LDFAAAAAFALVRVTVDELELEAAPVIDDAGATNADEEIELEIELVDYEVTAEDEELLIVAEVVFLLDEDVELEVPFVEETEVLFVILDVVIDMLLVTSLDVALEFLDDFELESCGSIAG
jgi:hypothetical protein